MGSLIQSVPASWDSIAAFAVTGLLSPQSRRSYERALTDFFRWCASGKAGSFTKATVQEYLSILASRGLAPSTVNLHACAIRKLATELADNGLLPLDAAAAIAKVKGARRKGVKLGNWLTTQQAEHLLAAPDVATLKGKRDRALLSVLLGAGLRRSEAAALTFAHIQQRDGRWVIADLIGKHNRIRTIPIPGWTKASIDLWANAAAVDDGPVFRPIDKADRLCGSSLTSQGIYHIVKIHAGRTGLNMTPHDMRRTFAKLARTGHAGLEQIQLSLGHASVTTTEVYLGTRQDLADAPCDHLGLGLS